MFLLDLLRDIGRLVRFCLVSSGVTSSLLLSVFIFRVFNGVDLPLLTHYVPGSDMTKEMAMLGVGCALYSFTQQQSLASRPAVSIVPALLDIVTSVCALFTLIIFGWFGVFLRLYTPTAYQEWALAMLTLITLADGVYNSFLSIRYLPRYFKVGDEHAQTQA